MSEMPWGDEKSRKFITNVGLITSDGPNGPNIMAAEWTFHVSYDPSLIAVLIGPGKATAENIKKTKEFGVSLASTDQTILSSVAGGSSGKDTDKIKAVEALGFKFYKAKKIKALMVQDAALNAECRLVKEIEFGDHIIFIGEVLLASSSKTKEPLAYHNGMYWKMTETLPKPSPEEREKIKQVIEKSSK